jgi:hypothetical protein
VVDLVELILATVHLVDLVVAVAIAADLMLVVRQHNHHKIQEFLV